MEMLRELGGEEISILISSHTVADLEKLADYLAFLHSGNLFLFEEKDRLLERYRAVQGTEGALKGLREQNVRLIGMRRGRLAPGRFWIKRQSRAGRFWRASAFWRSRPVWRRL